MFLAWNIFGVGLSFCERVGVGRDVLLTCAPGLSAGDVLRPYRSPGNRGGASSCRKHQWIGPDAEQAAKPKRDEEAWIRPLR